MKMQNKYICCVGSKLRTYKVRGWKTWLASKEREKNRCLGKSTGLEPDRTGPTMLCSLLRWVLFKTLIMENFRYIQKKRLLSWTIMVPITQFQQFAETCGFFFPLPPVPTNWIYIEANPRYTIISVFNILINCISSI